VIGARTIAVLGLGEAGAAIAADLIAAGARVLGVDPAAPGPPAGVELVPDAVGAVAPAEVVLSVNAAAVALEAAEAAAPGLGEGQLFADLNTAAPALKRELALLVEARGASFADVALLGPVPGRGVRAPALVSGAGAGHFAEVLGEFGMPIEEVGAEPGAAAARKLARSVFMKGLAAAIGEALEAAERLGCEDWLQADIEATLEAADPGLLRRLIEGSREHAGRRVDEMGAAVAMLEELGVKPHVAAASEAWLRGLAHRQVAT
jgi:3-hydroxyisobutyrate dehydrogenase-like beta-hydroxyacid dehydrogenase